MKFQNIGFIGGGRICRIFLTALKNKGFSMQNISVYDCSRQACETIKTNFPEVKIESNLNEVATSNFVILAIHPQVMMETLESIKPFISSKTIILSLAPKITIEAMKTKLGGFSKIARCNPNATSIINEGFNPVCFSTELNTDEKEAILEFLKLLGKSPEVEEAKLESYAVVSAMAPTYFWFLYDELYKISLSFGLSSDEAKDMLNNVIPASVNVYLEYGMDSYNLIPARPLKDSEEEIRNILRTNLTKVFDKLKN